MAKNPWHKRYHAAAIGGYMGLSLEERGAYTTLLDLMYDSDWAPGIPDRPRWIAGHLNCSVRKWEALREALIEAGKIQIVDGMISNSRYVLERENALETSRKRAENGLSGGRKSGEVRRKSNENNDGNEANASQKRSYTRAKDGELEIDIDDKSSIPPTPRKRPAKAAGFAVPDWIDKSAWDGFEEMRKRIKKPLTDHARELAVKGLATLKAEGHDPADVLNQSTMRGWAGLFAVKGNDHGNYRNGGSGSARPVNGFRAALDEAIAATDPDRDEFGGSLFPDGMG